MLLGASADVAEDAAQDVFVVAHRKLSDFDPQDPPRNWLFAIALRVVSSHRRSWRRRMRLLAQARSVESEPMPTPFELTAETEAQDILRAELLQLPEAQRTTFVLSDIEDMSVPQIAAVLGVNKNTVYSRLRIARRALIARLTQSGDEEDTNNAPAQPRAARKSRLS